MYYIEQQNDELVKYEVILKEEKLKELTHKIVDECGEITHKSYDSTNYTKLVTLINKLLKGETNVIIDLRNPTPEEKLDKEKIMLEKIDAKQQELKTASTPIVMKGKIKDLEECLKELKQIESDKELNKNRKSDLEYYPEVLECITLKEIERIKVTSLVELNELYEKLVLFFKPTTSMGISQDIDKKLYKRLI